MELELLNRPDSVHPEYLNMLRCVDDRRDEKIRYEGVKQRYDFEALNCKTVAERTQLHSQYFQEVREIRSRWFEKCYTDLFALQKDRRQRGAHDVHPNYLYNPKRPEQIQQQVAYNLEVSVLAGVAKHVGFPAAPDLLLLQQDEIDADLRAMAASRPAHQDSRVPIPGTQTMAERILQGRNYLREAEGVAAADNSFFEQNAWANPNVAHAMHAASQPQPTRVATPTRVVSNGSTVDLVMSTPASANQGLGLGSSAPPSNLHVHSARDALQQDLTPTQAPRHWKEMETETSPVQVSKLPPLPGRLPDSTERIQTTHQSGASATNATTATTAQDSGPSNYLEVDFSTAPLNHSEAKDVGFGGMGTANSLSSLATTVGGAGGGGSGNRFPP
jgi:hypothetical protein